MDSSLAHWKSLFAEADAAPLPRPAVDTPPDPAHRPLHLDVPDDGVRRAARTLDVPVRALLVAAHLRVLGSLTSKPQVTAVVAGAARDGAASTEPSLTPLHVDLTALTWAELAREVLRLESAAVAHPAVGYGHLAGAAPTLLPDNLLTVTEHPGPYGGGKDVGGAAEEDDAFFPLRVHVVRDRAAGLVTVEVRCDRSRVHPGVCSALPDYYRTVLAGLAADPCSVAARTEIRPSSERTETRAHSAGPPAPTADPATLPAQFWRQVRERPDEPAVFDVDEALTYRELGDRVDRLVRRFRDVGLGREDRVGLCVRRGVDLAVGLLAVLSAGAAYVPLDPDYPAARLAFIAEDADLHCLLVQAGTAPPVADVPVVPVEEWNPHGATAETASRSTGEVRDSDCAYVIYTSGSTGRPKGTVVEHRNVANFLLGMDHEIGIAPADRVLALTSVSFDISVLEILWPLTRGASVVICPERMLEKLFSGSQSLTALAHRFRPSLLQATPSFFSALCSHPGTLRSLAGLRALLVGGEALPRGLARQLAGALPGVRIVNMFGPTETTIWSLTHDLAGEDGGGTPVPIGRPLTQTTVRVVDGLGNDACVGATGELWIGGAGVARGYFRRPDLERDRFVSPADASHHRYYRTGDQVRWQENGVLEFLGRDDRQVKIRGHRIELDEVEGVLFEHPRVEAAAVVVERHASGGDELVAFVRPRPARDSPGTAPAADPAADPRRELRRFVGERLSPAMTPSRFVLVRRLPLLPTGKVDRSDLARLRAAATDTDAPGDGTGGDGNAHALVREVWSTVLGIQRIGPEDDFFELGGTSLTAVQMAARWVAAGGPPFDLGHFLSRPTARHLVEITQDDPTSSTADGPEPLDTEDVRSLAVLPPDIRPAAGAAPHASAPRGVLVVGDETDLCARLTHAFLERSTLTVSVLVTAADAEEATERLRATMASSGLPYDGYGERLHAVPGDPSRPCLGVRPAPYRRLVREVDLIVHTGRCFDRRSSWGRLSAANVACTREVLRLAATGPLKHVHVLTPLDVAAEAPEGLLPAEEVAGPLRLSKWVGERYVRQAAARGVPATTHRYGQVVSSRGQAADLRDEFLAALIHSCVSLRTAPDLDVSFPVTPAALLAGNIVETALAAGTGCVVDALAGEPVSWQEIVSDIRFSGRAVEVVPYEQWRLVLLDAAGRPGAVLPLARFLPLVGPDGLSASLGYRARRTLPGTAAATGVQQHTGDDRDRDLLRRYPSRRDTVGSGATRITVREHTVTVPLDHDRPDGATLTVFAQEVVDAEREGEDLPWLLFLQGGPGAPCPTPGGAAGWLGAALKGHRVLLLDQRGGGRSAPVTAESVRGRSPAQTAAYLRHFRADSIVADAEILREKIAGGRKWTILGQSYGGFLALTYLSKAPHGLSSVLVSGGLPPLEETAEEVYRLAYAELLEKNAAYYAEHPEDLFAVRRLADHLRTHDVRLPGGDRLTVRRLRLLGRNLGMSFAFERLHRLLEEAWDGDEVSETFRHAVAAETGPAYPPLYALQEFMYAQRGRRTGWAAHRVLADFPEFSSPSGPLLFFGEMMFPWMFREMAQLRPFAEVADLLADAADFPDLYDVERLAANTVPVVALVYDHDLYTPVSLQLRTAKAVGNTRVMRTDEFCHNGLMRNAALMERMLVRAGGDGTC
jgi:amino acid adenylation domain-containing protein